MCRGKSEFHGEATTAVARVSATDRLFPSSACPLPSRFWQVALEPPGQLSPEEQEHLRDCGRCRNRLARVLQAARAEDEADVEPEAAALVTEAAAAAPAAIGPYELLEPLGRGSLGAVYKARDRSRDRLVAVKVVAGGGPDRFRDEVRALSRLAHPNLARVYDAGADRGRPFVAREYVEGTDLDCLVRATGPLPAARACDYVRQAALALDYLHSAGVAHRDVKPQNLLLTPGGQVKVADFGLAARGGRTRTAEIRADLHGLGCTLYRLLTGGGPAPDEPIPMRVSAPDPALQRIYWKCCDRAESGYTSAGELAEDLAGFLAGRLLAAQLADPSPLLLLVVCPDGGGHHTRIGDAVRAAPPGTRVLVRPGLYREELLLDKPLEVFGEGPPGGVIVEGTRAPCLRLGAAWAAVRGLTLRGRRGAVEIPGGRLLLEDCTVTGETQAGVAVHGPTADPVLRRCRVQHGRAAGVHVWDGGRGRLEECDVAGHGSAGVRAELGGSPLLWRCHIRDNRHDGVHVSASGAVTLEECDVTGNGGAGVAVTYEGTAALHRCRVHDGGGPGVWVAAHGRGALLDTHVWRQSGPGVAVGPGGWARLVQSRIERNQGGPLRVSGDGTVLVQDCQVADAARSAAWVACGSRLK
jgi:tRNA A-37 threonylcarbamoyl transferase component Bud32